MSEIRRKLMASNKESIFESACFYCPYSETKSKTDLVNGIIPSTSTGSFSNEGYYVNGNEQYIEYTDNRIKDVFNNPFTIYLEVTPYQLTRNQCLLHIRGRSTYLDGAKIASIYIYRAKNNKFAGTVDANGTDGMLFDDVYYNSPVVSYGTTYKLVIKYNRTDNYSFFINGTKAQYNFYTNLVCYALLLGKNISRNDRGSKADFKTVAVWNSMLSDEECIKLTL